MISFQDVYDALRKEKYNEQLQSLPKKFFREVAEYLEDKKKVISKENSMFSDTIIKIKRQYENALSLIIELIALREKKILGLAEIASRVGLSKKDVLNMFSEEKELFTKTTNLLEEFQENIKKILENKQKKDLKKNIFIRFIKDVDKFSDLRGKELGPFKKGDMANLPNKIAEILIEGKTAIRVLSE